MPVSVFAPSDDSSVVQSEEKNPCKCGCKANISSWDPKVGASAGFKEALEEEVQLLLDKARQVKANIGRRY